MKSSSELDGWREEKCSSYLYQVIAKKEQDSPYGTLFQKLSGEAEKQANIWLEKAIQNGATPPKEFLPNTRILVVAALIRWFGARPLRVILSAVKVRGMSVYSTDVSHHEIPSSVDEIGKRHRGASTGGSLRAAVFGANDGLVSNASLILGIAGASANPKIIVLSGIAGLLAGAFSMASGEFVSVRSQREMFEYQIGLEREELKEYPREEAAELALIYQAKGLSKEEAQALADKLIADPERALDTLAREELGLNPDELGNPWQAALFSFLSFAVGAFVPLLPFLVGWGSLSLTVSIGLTATALFAVGATLSLFTGRSAWMGGLRMLLIGGIAGAATFFIGKLLGVTLS